jgi:hypothetical protein
VGNAVTSSVIAQEADLDLVVVIDAEDLAALDHTLEAPLAVEEETVTAREATLPDVTIEVAETEIEIEELRAEHLKQERARADLAAIARAAMDLALPLDLSPDLTAATNLSLLERPEPQKRTMASHLKLQQVNPDLTLKRALTESLDVYKV